MRIYTYGMDQEGDHVAIAENAIQDPDTLDWTSIDTARDSLLVEMLDSASDEGYITISHANATAGTITWTELFRFRHDGTITFNSVLTIPDAPGADQLKLFADYFLGRLQARVKSASETLNLVQSENIGRIWHSPDGSFPTGAKRGDVLFKPGSPGTLLKEIRLDVSSLGTGTAAPTKVILGDYVGYRFQIGDDSKFEFEVPHDYIGGDLELEAHLYCNATSGYVNWQIDYSCTPEEGGEALDAPTHSGSDTTGAFQIPSTANHLMEAGPMVIPASDVSPHDVIGVTFSRIANDGAEANPSSDPVILGIELEYHASKLL